MDRFMMLVLLLVFTTQILFSADLRLEKVLTITGWKSHDLASHLLKESDTYNIPIELALGIMKVESTFNPRASSRGNKGLFQINVRTAKGLLRDLKQQHKITSVDIMNPYTNISCALYHLSYLRSLHKSLAYTVVAYNQGIGGAKSYARSHNCARNAYYLKVNKNRIAYQQILKKKEQIYAKHTGRGKASPLR